LKPPVYYNRAGSDGDWAIPVIGLASTKSGTPTYEAVKFGNGTRIGSADYHTVSDIAIGSTAYTLEFWTKPVADQATNSYIFHWVTGAGKISYETQQYSGQLRIGQVDSGGGYDVLYYFTPTWTAGEVWHCAMVFNSGAGAGNRCKLYKNGVEISADSTPQDNTWSDSNLTLLPKDNYSGGNTWAIDNIKIYDYAKTDFSDRFNERSGLNDQTMVV
jgi:hypothetical protein